MTTALKPIDEIKNTLIAMKPQFELCLPRHIQSDKFIKVAETALINKPELSQLDRQSLYVAFTQAAQDGLLPDNREAAIVPFKGRAKYMPMVAGVCKKARNSGEIATINAMVVYENDEYEAWTDEKGDHFKHKRARGERGKPVLTYAYAITKDGGVYFEEIDEEQMSKIESMSKATDSPWKSAFRDEMKRKSALRRLCKYRLPNSSDIDFTFKQDDELYEEEPREQSEEKTIPSHLEKIVDAEIVEPTVVQAVVMAKEVFPEAKVIKQSPPPKKSNDLTIQGKIEDFKVKDGETNGKPWRRFYLKVGGKVFGTFDSKIGEQFAHVVDSGSEVKVTYKERTQNDKFYRDILAFEVFKDDDEEGIPI